MPTVYFEGHFVDEREAMVPVATHALQYGTAIFEGIRSYAGAGGTLIFRPDDHYARFHRNATLMHMELPQSPRELTELTVELLRRNGNPGDAYIRPLLYKSSTKIGAHLQPGETLAILTFVWPPTPLPPETASATFSHWRRFPHQACPAGAKISGLYVNSALAIDESRRRGFDQTILLSMTGEVAEGYGANIFAVFGNKVVTPPDSADILPGITRNTLIHHFQECSDLTVTVESIVPDRLYEADELFLCGTGLEIRPLVSLEGRPVGSGAIGPITEATARWYRSLVTGAIDAPGGWLVPV